MEAREDLNEVDGQDEGTSADIFLDMVVLIVRTVLLPIDCTYDPNGYPDRFKNFVRDNVSTYKFAFRRDMPLTMDCRISDASW